MTASLDPLRITIGPLRYEFHARDRWGECELVRLRGHVECVSFAGLPDRRLHLCECEPSQAMFDALHANALPQRLAALLPPDAPQHGWRLTGDRTGHLVWRHTECRDALWTHTVQPGDSESPFQLPWPLLLEDSVRRGGAIMHGGMASLDRRGYLFIAPPGGGKTTALSRIAPPWQLWSDDAVLVWTAGADGFRACPLPTWSVLLGQNTALLAIHRWQLGETVPVAGLLFLEKSGTDSITPLAPVEATPGLYRALCEYPTVLTNRTPFRQDFFHTAGALARSAPSWRLALTLDGNYWELLAGHPA